MAHRFLEDADRGFLLEPAKRVPIACEADVAVAGGGISGLVAAIAAGRAGAASATAGSCSSFRRLSGGAWSRNTS